MTELEQAINPLETLRQEAEALLNRGKELTEAQKDKLEAA